MWPLRSCGDKGSKPSVLNWRSPSRLWSDQFCVDSDWAQDSVRNTHVGAYRSCEQTAAFVKPHGRKIFYGVLAL